MKNAILWTVLMAFGLALLSSCATMPQRWPDQERSAENKMVVIQEKIGDGLKTGALTPDQSQMYLTTLKGIRTDYTALRDKDVLGTNGTGSMEDWMRLERRSTQRWPGLQFLQELKSQGMRTGLSQCKKELMMEGPAGACLRQTGEPIKTGWTPFGVIICG